jgi:nucleoside-diphosphate-sugar epimerase
MHETESLASQAATAQSFKNAFREHPAGVAVITAITPEGPVGLTASSVASVAVDPPALSFSVTRATGSAGALLSADTYVVHLLGTQHIDVAEAFARSGAPRFTPEQGFTTLPTGEPLESVLIEEDAPLDPRNVYAITKLTQEYLSTSWARSTGGRAIALRYHNVYGPGMPQNTPYAGVASLFRSALARGEAPRVFEDGGQRRDFVHVDDIAGANLAALAATADATSGSFRAYNVGSGHVHTIGDMAEALSRHADGPAPIVTGEYRLGDVRHITASSERLETELGYRARVGFDDGMREFATAPLRDAVQR